MPNPALLLCDSDALVQLFIANEFRPLQSLRTQFNIQPAVVLEVDLELRWLGKHKDRFVPPLDKALKNQRFRVISAPRRRARRGLHINRSVRTTTATFRGEKHTRTLRQLPWECLH
jgi:hypothetical protein